MTVESQANVFQKYLIPEKSSMVRSCMKDAAAYGKSSNFFYAHFVSIAFATTAIALSFLNTFSYIFSAPLRIPMEIVQGNLRGVMMGPLEDITNSIRSFVFVAVGITLVMLGFLFPQILSHFAPEYSNTLEDRLRQKIDWQEKKITSLEEELKNTKERLLTASDHIVEKEEEIDALKKRLVELQKPQKPKDSWIANLW